MDLENPAWKTGVTVLEDCNSQVPGRRHRVGSRIGPLTSSYEVPQDAGLTVLKVRRSRQGRMSWEP